MIEKYVSEQLLVELSNPLIVFIWYLWEVYCDPESNENIFLLRSGENGQRITILPLNKIVEKDFGKKVDTTIRIQKHERKYYMSR